MVEMTTDSMKIDDRNIIDSSYESFAIVVQGPENKLLFSVSDTGIVQLGDDVTPDEAAKAFWAAVQSMGARLRLQALEEVAKWYEKEGWLLDEADVPDAIRKLKSRD
jgi:hypothetical protein